jgi:hypothetical protein
LFEPRRHGVLVSLRIIARFGFRRRDISDRFEDPLIIEPMNPFVGRELDGLGVAPGTAAVDHRGDSLEQTLGVADLNVLHAAVTMGTRSSAAPVAACTAPVPARRARNRRARNATTASPTMRRAKASMTKAT